MTEEKEKVIKNIMHQIEKQFGIGAVMRLGDKLNMKIESIPTGSLRLDIALGIGGVPRGRIIEIFGPESSGKTTLALHILAESQKRGGVGAFIDAEHALDAIYAEKLGVNVEDLIISQPDTGEQALEITEKLIRSEVIEVVVIDSVAALVPKQEIEGDMGSTQIGLQARLMSQALRKLTAIAGKTNTIVIFINQLREKIGLFFGNSETTPGGRALKFYSSVRLEVKRIGKLENSEGLCGNKTKVKVVKNKVAPPFKEAEFDIIYGKGISKSGNILDLAIESEIVKQNGSWFSYNENKMGQGRESAKKFLEENTDVCLEIENIIRKEFDLNYE
ncbi:MAG: recombinase RecA [Clostridiales bacterium]|jgi:recombination protein RecA|nr:recombinase RecA [Clostridiales bacterium]